MSKTRPSYKLPSPVRLIGMEFVRDGWFKDIDEYAKGYFGDVDAKGIIPKHILKMIWEENGE